MTNDELKIIEHISNLAGGYKCYDVNMTHEEALILDKILTEYKTLKEIDEDVRLKYCHEDLSSAEQRGYFKGLNKGVDNFANYLHKKAKENGGLRLSSETRSWTHPSVFDYVKDFKEEEICKIEEIDLS